MASKYPQKICFCNASDMPHKHEDDRIVDFPNVQRETTALVTPKSVMFPRGFVASK